MPFLAAGALWTAGCAIHTPERATTRFVHELTGGLALSEGSPAFEKARTELHLQELSSKKKGNAALRRSASWSHKDERLALVSSNVLRDPPDRFDLRLSWDPPRGLRKGLLEKLLGAPYGTSATRDHGWVIDGGVLEYRATETETPYLVFSSPGYIRDPLDFLEAANLPHLPELVAVRFYLERNGSVQKPPSVEQAYLESQEFEMASRDMSIVLYTSAWPRHPPYLVGIEIRLLSKSGFPAKPSDFVPILTDLGVPTPGQLTAAIFRETLQRSAPSPESGTEDYQVYNNFALALSYPRAAEPEGDTILSIWRRIESPGFLCGHLRPDLDRCSGSQ